MDINQRLTEELKKQILAAETLVAVEDLYRPYRPKRRTRAILDLSDYHSRTDLVMKFVCRTFVNTGDL